MSWAGCSECDMEFTSDYGFDRHRVNMTGKPGYDPEYDWRCASPEEMHKRGFSQNAKGWWRSDRQTARFALADSSRTGTKGQVGR